MKTRHGLVFSAALAIAAFAATVGEAQRELPPEAASGSSARTLAVGSKHMISTANRHASEAGREMLRKGGSATDAAIAAQLVLGLVEPQSSGLGGGAFFVHWNANAKRVETWDGRETAPAAANPDRFMRNGKPMPFSAAVHSGLSAGTPGLVRLLETVHREHGKLPWAALFEPALRLARNGFAVSPRLHLLLRWNGPNRFDDAARRYFFDDGGNARPAGHVLKNPQYAATLEALAANGAEAFYQGPIAEAVVAAVKNAPNAAGDMTLDDLASYQVVKRDPLCFAYRSRRLCGMGPPSSGGVAVAQTLALIEPFDLGRGPNAAMNSRAIHLIAEAQKLAYADRDRYLADPAFTPVPEGLTDAAYLASRRKLMDLDGASPKQPPGTPPGLAQAYGDDATVESAGTSHISVVDADGNAVAMTTTIESAFGSGLWAAGFLLNNELTDFSFAFEDKEGRPIANRVEGGKRPRSTMAPFLVFDREGRFQAALGSPGGSWIILYVVKALVALIDWNADAQTAAALANFGSRNEGFEIELGWAAPWTALRMAGYGHAVSPSLMTSGVNVVAVRDGRLEGGADPRRESTALGD